MRKFRNLFTGRRGSRGVKRRSQRRFESLENRNMFAGISFDDVTGIVSVAGSRDDDTVIVQEVSSDQIRVTLTTDTGTKTQEFDQSDVTQISFKGGAGNDRFENQTSVASVVDGGKGRDTLIGGSGNDVISGGKHLDIIWGGSGVDTLDGGHGPDEIYGQEDTDYIYGGSEGDVLHGGAGVDWIYGNGGVDTIFGGDGGDFLYGGTENDTIYGYGGDDTMFGGDGDDELIGGDGPDKLHGGTGRDYLDGGMDGVDDNDEDDLWGDEAGDVFVQYRHHEDDFGSKWLDILHDNDDPGDSRITVDV